MTITTFSLAGGEEGVDVAGWQDEDLSSDFTLLARHEDLAYDSEQTALLNDFFKQNLTTKLLGKSSSSGTCSWRFL